MSVAIKKMLGNGSYCALPFVHNYLNLDGNNYLCCYSRTKIDPVQEIKQIQSKLIAGEKIEHCVKCYDWEKQGSISPRIKETIGLLKNSRIVTTLEQSIKDINQAVVLSYDIRYDNRCNLACIGCNPKDSSLWARKLKIPIELVESTGPSAKQIANSEKIYLAGGEPLINDKVYQLLNTIAQQDYQPEIVINSNIASVKPKFYEVFARLKNLSITVSFDGHGQVNEYHRWPLQWNKFLNNLKTINSMGIYTSWNTVVDSVSVWGLAQMISIENFTQAWNIRVLQGPQSLQLRNLLPELKSLATEQIVALQKSKFSSTDPVFKTRIQLALNELDCPGFPDLLAENINFLDQQRKINHEHYLGVKLT